MLPVKKYSQSTISSRDTLSRRERLRFKLKTLKGNVEVKKYGRVDANQRDCVNTWRSAGFSVWLTTSLGNGAPDCVVGRNGWTIPVEIKDGRKPPSAQVLTPDEERFHAEWRGGKILIINNALEGLKLLIHLTKEKISWVENADRA